jgi:hypothetical protein
MPGAEAVAQVSAHLLPAAADLPAQHKGPLTIVGGCASVFRADEAVRVATGEVFALGQACSTSPMQPGGFALARWGRGGAKGVVERAPGDTPIVRHLTAASATEAYVVGESLDALAGGGAVPVTSPAEALRAPVSPQAYGASRVGQPMTPAGPGGEPVSAPGGSGIRYDLLRFDGAAWRRDEAPAGGKLPMFTLAVDDEGALWTATDEAEGQGHEVLLWRRPRGGAWASVGAFARKGQRARVTSVWVRGAGDVWATTIENEQAPLDERRVRVLHTRPASAVFSESGDLVDGGVEGGGCQTPFVQLYQLAAGAPADYDFATLRAALKGHPELQGKATLIEYLRRGQRFVGLRAADAETAETVEALVRKGVESSLPEVRCEAPQATRTLDVDFATGQLRK